MLNPNGLDGPRGFGAQYGQQQSNSGFPLGALAGGMQAATARGALGGMQSNQSGQQLPQQRFPGQAQLPSIQQQLNQYQARPGMANGNLMASNAAVAAAAAATAGNRAAPALGMGNQNLGMRPAGVDGRGLANMQGLANLAGGQSGHNIAGYGQNPLAAALGSQQALNSLGMNRLAGMNNLQQQMQNQMNARVNLFQQAQQQQQQQQQKQQKQQQDQLQQARQQQIQQQQQLGLNNPQDLLSLLNQRAKQQQQQQQQQQTTGGQQGAFSFGHNQQQQQQGGGSGGTNEQAGAGDSEFPALEGNADFPTLGGNQPVQQPSGDMYAGLRKAGGVGNEFSIQSEDFPALPGAPAPRAGFGRGGLDGNSPRGGFPTLTTAEPNQDQILWQQQQMRDGAAGGKPTQGKGLAATPAPDRYGLLGLMPLVKMSDPDLSMLALGTDLTSLGLNLNSSDSLYKTFFSPLSDTPVKPEPEFDLPACYRHTPQRLQPGYLTKLKEETLFYMFYSMPQDEAQLVAADELSTRGWWYHKRFKIWMIQAPNAAMQKNQRGERGSFLVFDPSVWEVVPKVDLEVVYEDVEQAPRLPRPKHLQPAARH